MNTSLEKFEGELNQVAGKIETVQSTVEELKHKHTHTHTAEEARMTELEKRMENRSATLGSHAEGDGERRRALIMGGWAEDKVAAETREAAKSMVAQLGLDIDGGIFVPGIISGYVIISYAAKTGESESHLQDRLRAATMSISRVRQANVLTGESGPQGPKRLWLNFSTSPDKRKRAGKIKRAVIEAGGAKEQLEVEFATASVWYKGQKGYGTALVISSSWLWLG